MISRIAAVMKTCQEEKLMGHLGVVLYEYLGEEYPEVLGSILAALKAIVNVIGMHKMTPPIKDLLPRLTPILKVFIQNVFLRIVSYKSFFCFCRIDMRKFKKIVLIWLNVLPIVDPSTYQPESGCASVLNYWNF